MFKQVLFVLFLSFSIALPLRGQSVQYPELELVEVSQMKASHNSRFDLSGIVAVKNRYYVVADKSDNRFIYEVKFSKRSWTIVKQLPISISGKLDLEAIDACHRGCFYISNEYDNQTYKVNKKGGAELVPVDYAVAGINLKEWSTNTGLESLALDCKNKVLYLAKEREPRFIIKIDLLTGKILDQFTIPETESNDFADMKYDSGFLYLLERNGNYVSKVDPISHTVIAKVSYRAVSSAPEGKLFEPSEFGMEEALLLTKDEIWLGVDNNELEVSPSAAQKHNIAGTLPVILKFKRPKGF